jgi:hypothetical protein
LTPEAKAAIHELLGADVGISDAEIASWADQIRPERRSTAPWHYVGISTTQPSYDAERDGSDGANVIDAIDRFEKVLAGKSKPKEERAEALKFLVHLVGDVHQPLHCAERGHDRGGNELRVYFLDQKRRVNRHMVWDTQILLHDKGKARVLEYARWLNEQISPQQAAAWSKGTPEDWANESHQVAVNQVYKNVPADGDQPKLDAVYVRRAEPVVEEQLQHAGVRLAEVLNRSLRD